MMRVSSFAAKDFGGGLEIGRPLGGNERAIAEQHLVSGLDREPAVVQLDEAKLLGLLWVTGESIVDGYRGEQVLALKLSVTVLGGDFHASEVRVFDRAELAAVAVPALGVVWLPHGFMKMEC